MFSYNTPVYDLDGNYTITAVEPRLVKNNDMVRVSYAVNLDNKEINYDWIGFWSPADADPLVTCPARFAWCDEDPDFYTTGTGTLSFNMTNLRADGMFYYVTGGTYYPTIRSMAPNLTIDFDDYSVPLRGRVVPSGDPDKMWVMWSSDGSHQTPELQWGLTSGIYPNTASAMEDVIDQSELCGAPANDSGWREMGTIYRADLVDMVTVSVSSSPKVYYRFGDSATDNWSEEHVFNVPPLAGHQPKSGRGTRLVMYDDLGRGSTDDSYTWHEYGRPSIDTTMAVGEEVRQGLVDAVYHGGDISYATGFLVTWDYWLNQISPVASGAMYLTNLGNHESDWTTGASFYNGTDSGGECGIPSTRHLPLPSVDGNVPGPGDAGSTNKPWWGYDVGIIHLVGMSTEHDFRKGSEQWDFLKADLAAVNRTKTPWIIFGGHRAMYINSDYLKGFSSDGEVSALLVEHIEPLLIEYGVDLSFYGHNHAVQRHSAIVNYTVVQAATPVKNGDGNTVYTHVKPGAPVHMVIGTGGAKFTENSMTPGPDWNELVFYKYGYARVEAVSANELQWEWVESQSGTVYDRMAIFKEQPDTDDEGGDNGSSLREQYHTEIMWGCTVGSVAFLIVTFIVLWYKGLLSKSVTGDDGSGLLGKNAHKSSSVDFTSFSSEISTSSNTRVFSGSIAEVRSSGIYEKKIFVSNAPGDAL